jgi:hypothetical protein
VKHLNVDDSNQPAYVIQRDVDAQHIKYWPTFTKAKQDIAVKLKQHAVDTFFRSKVYLNARDKFITVKVDRPHMADKLQNAKQLAAMNAFVVANGAEVAETNNALLFRIYK